MGFQKTAILKILAIFLAKPSAALEIHMLYLLRHDGYFFVMYNFNIFYIINYF